MSAACRLQSLRQSGSATAAAAAAATAAAAAAAAVRAVTLGRCIARRLTVMPCCIRARYKLLNRTAVFPQHQYADQIWGRHLRVF